jgi:hypothetical protein
MMGNWKLKQLLKQGKASRTRSSPAKLFLVLPPPGGWEGGLPTNNGYPAKAWPYKRAL